VAAAVATEERPVLTPTVVVAEPLAEPEADELASPLLLNHTSDAERATCDAPATLAPPQPRLSTAIFTLLMNKRKYESLPADLKKVIDDNSGMKLAPRAIEIWDRIELAGEKVMRSKKKNKFVSLSAEETAKFKKAVQPVFKRFEKMLDDSGANGAQVIADAEKMIEKHAK